MSLYKDENLLWIQISSGTGPIECCLAVKKFYESIVSEAKKERLSIDIIKWENFNETLPKSILLSIDKKLVDLLKLESGTVQYRFQSSFRPQHKRKNWFIDTLLLEPPKDEDIDLTNIKIETMRAGGPGGQHQNKTESAVRVTHIPTGISVIAREERSQYRNKKLALARLLNALNSTKIEKSEKSQEKLWKQHYKLKRGEAFKIY
ncbi:peptide chain release factor H [bacterium]|nr:peptide chain release factor H [bacterium]